MIEEFFTKTKYRRLEILIDGSELGVSYKDNEKLTPEEKAFDGYIIRWNNIEANHLEFNHCCKSIIYQITLKDKNDKFINGLELNLSIEAIEELRDYLNFILDDATEKDK